jgi:stearoyl-CoA desaturase (delta-9 desaturase)
MSQHTHDDIMYPAAVPFVLVHIGCLAAIWTGVTWQALAICVGLYWLRIFGIGAGYHRYFSHRSYATSRAFQCLPDDIGRQQPKRHRARSSLIRRNI